MKTTAEPQHLVPNWVLDKMMEARVKARPWSPWPYQERAMKDVLGSGQHGMLADPGCGKTSTTLAVAKILLQKRMVSRVLVTPPIKPMYDVWPMEVSEWSDFHNLNIAMLHDCNKERRLRELQPHHHIVLINHEGLQWLFDSNERIRQLGADMLVVDEVSKFKNQRSVRFKLLRRRLPLYKRRLTLTGSPNPRHYMDLWAETFILDQGLALGQYITQYRTTYFYPSGFEMRDWSLLPGAEKRINAAIAPLYTRIDAKDHLKMPKDPTRIHRVQMPLAVAAEYNKLEQTLMSTLFSGPMQNSTAARSKLCQMANGSVYTDKVDPLVRKKKRSVATVHTAKVDELAELVDELQGEPLLVSIGYHHDYDAIASAVGEVPVIRSGISDREASNIVTAWNANKLSVLAVHPASMGHGMNMQKGSCRHVAIFDIPDDYDLYDQVFRRVWRQGNNADFVMRHLFITSGTVDDAKLANLNRKGRGQKGFLDAMREYTNAKYGIKKGGKLNG